MPTQTHRGTTPKRGENILETQAFLVAERLKAAGFSEQQLVIIGNILGSVCPYCLNRDINDKCLCVWDDR